MKKFENEFLIRLAAIWFACRFRCNGGHLTPRNAWPKPLWWNELMGERDYAAEMRLLCAEIKVRHV